MYLFCPNTLKCQMLLRRSMRPLHSKAASNTTQAALAPLANKTSFNHLKDRKPEISVSRVDICRSKDCSPF